MIHLGCEKRYDNPRDVEKDNRLMEVPNGVKKPRKWLADANIQTCSHKLAGVFTNINSGAER